MDKKLQVTKVMSGPKVLAKTKPVKTVMDDVEPPKPLTVKRNLRPIEKDRVLKELAERTRKNKLSDKENAVERIKYLQHMQNKCPAEQIEYFNRMQDEIKVLRELI